MNYRYTTPEVIGLLETLTLTNGGSGDEKAVRDLLYQEIKDHVDSIRVDQLGNMIVHKAATATPSMKVMVAAHMDEVSLMVVDKKDEGFLEVRPVGGIDANALSAKPVVIGKDSIPGVFSARTIHITSASERKSLLDYEKLRVSVGKKKIEKINPGDYVYFMTPFERLGDFFAAKAIDDRVGCANLIWLLKNAPGHIDLYGVFTVQEELGLRGAKVAAYQIMPDLGFAFDATPAIEPPLMDSNEHNYAYNTQTGRGPAIYTVDRGQVHNEKVIFLIRKVAEKHDIPYQLRQPGGGGTDSSAIHMTGSGIISQSISVPTRYLHSPISMMRQDDWEHTLHLIDTLFSELSPEIIKE